jgi:hypothetical protein
MKAVIRVIERDKGDRNILYACMECHNLINANFKKANRELKGCNSL